jgi:hypothetical protein
MSAYIAAREARLAQTRENGRRHIGLAPAPVESREDRESAEAVMAIARAGLRAGAATFTTAADAYVVMCERANARARRDRVIETDPLNVARWPILAVGLAVRAGHVTDGDHYLRP